ncbi:mitochondrial K+-H+ exchange-related-domain-containing protein [Dipodascopsis uninucleata]
MRILFIPLSARRNIIIAQRMAATSPGRARQRLDDRLAERVQKIWTKWESSSTWWKKSVVSWGNAALDRIAYEEWSLKSMPHAPPGISKVGPKKWWQIWRWGEKEPNDGSGDTESLIQTKVAVLFPPKVVNEDAVIDIIGKFAAEQKPFHLNRMLICTAIAPLTLPVALVPLIPNIPGFYFLYRIWSHWKAMEGAELLLRLVKEDRLVLEPNHTLETFYEHSSAPPEDDFIILHEDKIHSLVLALDAPELESELRRAVTQIRHQIAVNQQKASGNK